MVPDPAPFDGGLLQSIETEAHFMMLRALRRDRPVGPGSPDESDQPPQHRRQRPGLRARFQQAATGSDAGQGGFSNTKDRGHEYFDFAAPPGHQIDSVTLRVDVEGIAEIGFSVPQPAGWPPQFSFSKRFENLKFSRRGRYAADGRSTAGHRIPVGRHGLGTGAVLNTPAEVAGRQSKAPTEGSRHPQMGDLVRRFSKVGCEGGPRCQLPPRRRARRFES